MKSFVQFLAVSAAVAGGCASSALAHFDIAPYVENDKIVTGGYSHDNAAEDTAGPLTVYGYDFGEILGQPNYTADPGVAIRKPASGTAGWNNGSQLNYTIVSPLKYWDGSGSFALTAPASTDYVEWFIGGARRSITGSSGVQNGFFLDSADTGVSVGQDIFHVHMGAFLWGPSGDSVNPEDGGYVAPAAGIYAFQIELKTNQAGVGNSDRLWIVYNYGLSEEQHDEALVGLEPEAPGVPEPATLSVLGLGAGLLLRRRRR